MRILSLKRILVLLALASVRPGYSTDFETILLPIAVPYEVPGAFGSRWLTWLIARNDNSQSVIIKPYRSTCGTECPSGEVAANTTVVPAFSPAFPHPGAFIYVSQPGSARVTFN